MRRFIAALQKVAYSGTRTLGSTAREAFVLQALQCNDHPRTLGLSRRSLVFCLAGRVSHKVVSDVIEIRIA